MKYDFIKVGATVCWHDPEGISEGIQSGFGPG